MKRIVSLSAIMLLVFLFLGCSGYRNKKALPSVRYSGMTGKRSLVVLLPTIGGKGSHYETEGFLDEVWERGFEASLEVVDVTPTLYLGDRIVGLLKTEVIEPAKSEGFEEFYLVGISLGGHAVLLYATEYPEDVDGVVVIEALRVYVSNPRNRKKIVLGFGTEDIFFEQCRILAEVLPPEQVFTVSGGHDWPTWKKLFMKVADYFKDLKIQRDK
jgi:hypothetical protein